MFIRRDGTDDRWLEAKVWLFTAGAVLGVLGMALAVDPLIWAAAAVLAVGVALRFIRPRSPGRDGSGPRGPGPGDGAT